MNIEDIKQRLEKATPGPWTVYHCGFNTLNEENRACGVNECFDASYDECHHVLDRNDAELMANAPTDIAFLLQELDKVQRENERLIVSLQKLANATNDPSRVKWPEV